MVSTLASPCPYCRTRTSGRARETNFFGWTATETIVGTGTEDYFLGAWAFGGAPIPYFGAPGDRQGLAGERSTSTASTSTRRSRLPNR